MLERREKDASGTPGWGAPLFAHVRRILLERFLLTGAAVLAFAAVAMGRVRPAEIPGLLDARLLMLFAVLIVAVELGKSSGLFDRLVAAAVARARTARALAFSLWVTAGLLAMFLTNDVALFLIVPFTLLFHRVTDMNLAPLVILEISATNLVGALTPVGNPQNLFLSSRGGLTPAAFVVLQLPIVAAGAVLLSAATLLLLPARVLPPIETRRVPVDTARAAGFLILLGAELASIARIVPPWLPLLLALGGAALLGRRLFETDFSLVFVFAFLFVGVAGLERGRLYAAVDPERIFGGGGAGMLVSGALLSQLVSNVPAAMLLAPAAAGGAALQGLLWGVTAGGCGTPIASIANLIGAQLFLQSGAPARPFWKTFTAVSGALLVALTLFALLLLKLRHVQ
ncbi:MAG TPA: SLC13 family permease [Thermoanaerobaculia bacterium]|nr:SLC13 family permease [Thermoanaerobaculia bacterium]